MIVMKFGGTSVGTGERMLNVARIAARTTEQTTEPPIVVVSAMSGVTDSLVRAATTAADGDKETFRAIRKELQVKHEQAIIDCAITAALAQPLRTEADSMLDWFENLCQSMSTLGELTPRGLDVVSGLGERLSARLVAGAMLGQGIKAEMVSQSASEINVAFLTDNSQIEPAVNALHRVILGSD